MNHGHLNFNLLMLLIAVGPIKAAPLLDRAQSHKLPSLLALYRHVENFDTLLGLIILDHVAGEFQWYFLYASEICLDLLRRYNCLISTIHLCWTPCIRYGIQLSLCLWLDCVIRGSLLRAFPPGLIPKFLREMFQKGRPFALKPYQLIVL